MSWRASPFFERQFRALCSFHESHLQAPFVEEVLASHDDFALSIFADWLEEQGDPRFQYIRDMCALADGVRPVAELLERVNRFEYALRTNDLVLHRTMRGCSLFVITKQLTCVEERSVILNEMVPSIGRGVMVVDASRQLPYSREIINLLVLTFQAMRNQGKSHELCVCALSANMDEVFRILRLHRIFHICNTPEEAIDFACRPTSAMS